MKVIPVSCKQPLIFIYLLNKNRRQEALCTRLLLVDNARRSKCFFRMVKMWIKEIRFYFSVFGYQVKNLKGNMDLKAGLSRFRTTLYDYLFPTQRLAFLRSILDSAGSSSQPFSQGNLSLILQQLLRFGI